MPLLLDKRLVFVTGKGGTGKTTVAAALGLAAARAGKRTIVVEVSSQERMSRAFRSEGVGYEETELSDGLWAMSVDPKQALDEYLGDQVGRRLSGLLFNNRIFEYFAAAAPGVPELATIGKVWDLAHLERGNRKQAPYDLVIVDAPASGHGLAMLRTPRTFGEIARVGPVRRRADVIHEFITDGAKTGVVAVALPQEMPVNETIEFREKLDDEMGMDTDVVVMNALLPERFSTADIERIDAADDAPVSDEAWAALHAARSEHSRARSQRAQLRRLKRDAGTGVITLPYLWEPELGLEDFERLADELERKL
jgi:anion-transporting  ArsA/GET3 family ATPase